MIVRWIPLGAALALLAGANGASAQIAGGARLRTVDYYPGQVTRIEAAPGYQLAIEFAADERIENVAVGDSAAWQATPNKRGDRMFLKLVSPGVATNMVVITDVREYLFDLVPVPGADPGLAYIVRFRAPVAAAMPTVGTIPNAASGVVGRYHVTGERALRPSGIEDDGVHTFLQWPLNVGLPAVYAVDALGRETLVNGMVRGNLFVVDSVSDTLVFRLDRKMARATRLADKRK